MAMNAQTYRIIDNSYVICRSSHQESVIQRRAGSGRQLDSTRSAFLFLLTLYTLQCYNMNYNVFGIPYNGGTLFLTKAYIFAEFTHAGGY
jgi:hypothetical protein